MRGIAVTLNDPPFLWWHVRFITVHLNTLSDLTYIELYVLYIICQNRQRFKGRHFKSN